MRNPYTCIFKRTLASRIWSLSPTTRCVWLWLKLQADPEGFVGADMLGVAFGANVPVEDARRAIEGFCSPDPDADPDDPHGGRVLERVRGGWLILDHESERALAKVEAHNARNAKYARARRAREREEKLQEAQAVAVALAEGRDPREVMNDVEPTDAYAEAPVCAPKTKPKPTTKPTTGGEDSPSPLPPVEVVDPERMARWREATAASASMPVPLHSMPDGFVPSDELRADAQLAGVTNLDERIKSLETGPIGGTRGVLPHKLEDYIRSFFGKWKTWEETDRAKARAAAAAPASSRRGPPAAPIPEPKEKHKRMAARWGINLSAAVGRVVALRVHESGGEKSFFEYLEKDLVAEAQRIKEGRAA